MCSLHATAGDLHHLCDQVRRGAVVLYCCVPGLVGTPLLPCCAAVFCFKIGSLGVGFGGVREGKRIIICPRGQIPGRRDLLEIAERFDYLICLSCLEL